MSTRSTVETSSKEDPAARLQAVYNLADEEGVVEAPTDINVSDPSTKSIQLPELTWRHYGNPPARLVITNTGHTVNVGGKWESDRSYLRDGPFKGQYVFAQMHFHWGPTDESGSEHSVEGMKLPLELHVVHINRIYRSQEMALKENDGVAILIYLFQLQGEDNSGLAPIVEALPKVVLPKTSTSMDGIAIERILVPFHRDFFMYWGAVSSPTCKHRILWLSCRVPLGISSGQLAQFRQIRDVNGQYMVKNFRETNPRKTHTLFHVNPSSKLDRTLLAVHPGHALAADGEGPGAVDGERVSGGDPAGTRGSSREEEDRRSGVPDVGETGARKSQPDGRVSKGGEQGSQRPSDTEGTQGVKGVHDAHLETGGEDGYRSLEGIVLMDSDLPGDTLSLGRVESDGAHVGVDGVTDIHDYEGNQQSGEGVTVRLKCKSSHAESICLEDQEDVEGRFQSENSVITGVQEGGGTLKDGGVEEGVQEALGEVRGPGEDGEGLQEARGEARGLGDDGEVRGVEEDEEGVQEARGEARGIAEDGVDVQEAGGEVGGLGEDGRGVQESRGEVRGIEEDGEGVQEARGEAQGLGEEEYGLQQGPDTTQEELTYGEGEYYEAMEEHRTGADSGAAADSSQIEKQDEVPLLQEGEAAVTLEGERQSSNLGTAPDAAGLVGDQEIYGEEGRADLGEGSEGLEEAGQAEGQEPGQAPADGQEGGGEEPRTGSGGSQEAGGEGGGESGGGRDQPGQEPGGEGQGLGGGHSGSGGDDRDGDDGERRVPADSPEEPDEGEVDEERKQSAAGGVLQDSLGPSGLLKSSRSRSGSKMDDTECLSKKSSRASRTASAAGEVWADANGTLETAPGGGGGEEQAALSAPSDGGAVGTVAGAPEESAGAETPGEGTTASPTGAASGGAAEVGALPVADAEGEDGAAVGVLPGEAPGVRESDAGSAGVARTEGAVGEGAEGADGAEVAGAEPSPAEGGPGAEEAGEGPPGGREGVTAPPPPGPATFKYFHPEEMERKKSPLPVFINGLAVTPAVLHSKASLQDLRPTIPCHGQALKQYEEEKRLWMEQEAARRAAEEEAVKFAWLQDEEWEDIVTEVAQRKKESRPPSDEAVTGSGWPYEPYVSAESDAVLLSPIDLPLKDVPEVKLRPLVFDGHFDMETMTKIANTGETVEVRVLNPGLTPTLHGGPLTDDYIFDSMHFHWSNGPTPDCLGSAHRVGGQRFCMEAHLLHYRAEHRNKAEALKHQAGVCAVAFMLHLSGIENAFFTRLSRELPEIESPLSSAPLAHNALLCCQEAAQPHGYVTYPGTLIGRQDNLNVVWIVYQNPIGMCCQTTAQFQKLRAAAEFAPSDLLPTHQVAGRPVLRAVPP